MCLAIPGVVERIDTNENFAMVNFNGLKKQASLMLQPEVKIGDFVLVHAGFIIQIIDQENGEELSGLWEEIGFEGL